MAQGTGYERLRFLLELQDRLTGRLGVVKKRIDAFTAGVRRHTETLQRAAVAGAAAVLALAGAMQPAIAHSREMAKLSTLGLDPGALRQVETVAFDTAERFGLSAQQIVGSAYDIQSAIAGLSGQELAGFTRTAAVLGKATLADPATIADYLGTLYGVFGRQADAMGRDTWAKITAGMTAQAVQMFKVTGPKLAQAFGQLGADATALGVAQAEQFAVLGTLGATMEGGMAASRFQAFLRGTGGAQSTLGLSFTDARGQMLPVVEILERIRGKFGEIDTVAEADLLKKAFGSDEAASFIKLLVSQTDKLRGNVETLGKTKGMGAAEEMARRGTITFDRLKEALRNTATAFSGSLLAALDSTMNRMAEGLSTVRGWIDRFPYLTKVIAWGVVGFTALVGVAAAFAAVSALIGIIWSPVTLILLAVGVAVAALVYWWDDLVAAWDALPDWARAIVKALNPIATAWNGIAAAIEAGRAAWNWIAGEDGPSLREQGLKAETVPEVGAAARVLAGAGTGRGTHVGTLNINTTEKVDFYAMERQIAMAMP